MTNKSSSADFGRESLTHSANSRKKMPISELRFLCDEMLRGLARWLRAAGYDTGTANPGSADSKLLRQAYVEQRVLLTRDRKLAQHYQAGASIIVLNCNDIDSCARALSQQISVNWLFRPFTRCLLCNTPLKTADPNMLKYVPEQSQPLAHPLLYCPNCNKIYWNGSHVSRMRQRLQQWSTPGDGNL